MDYTVREKVCPETRNSELLFEAVVVDKATGYGVAGKDIRGWDNAVVDFVSKA